MSTNRWRAIYKDRLKIDFGQTTDGRLPLTYLQRQGSKAL
jgi:hypothetical protein